MNVLPQIARLKGIALDLLFPQRCVGCGKWGYFICPFCRQSLSHIEPPLCPKCGRPQPSGILCSACISWQAQIDGIRSPFRFDGAIRKAVHELKYRNLRAIASPLAELLNEYLAAHTVPADVLVPIPLHPRRLRERGYNQSGLLALELGKLGQLPIVTSCLIRQRDTPPQARTVSVEERRRNIAKAFICLDNRIRDQRILVIDDVATSGATLDAAAGALKSAGASSVWGLTVAREI